MRTIRRMIVINGRLTIDPARRADFVAACVTMQQASRAEEPCLHYVFTADLEHDDVFHIAEKWASDEGLKTHFGLAHMAAFQKGIAGVVKGIDVTKYEIASEGPVR